MAVVTPEQAIHDGITPVWTPGGVHELRVPDAGRKRVVSGYFDSPELFARAAARLSGTVTGVYVTLNPVIPALFARSANRLTENARSTTNDTDIAGRRWLPLDFDAVRPAGISSTNEQHEAAISRAREAARWLVARGLHRDSILSADSGNGAHLLVRVDLPNNTAALDLIRRCTEAVSIRFSDQGVTVDLGMVNASRIWKVYGTKVCKGSDLPEFPHRTAHVRVAPDTFVVASMDQLQALAELAPPPMERPTRHTGQQFDVRAFVARHLGTNVLYDREWQGGHKWVLRECPFNPDHNDKSAVVIEMLSGAGAFKCQHNSCQFRKWQDLRELFEPAHLRGTVATPPTSTTSTNGHAPSTDELPPMATPFEMSDLGNGKRLIARHGGDLLYCNAQDAWYVWDGTRFARDQTLEIMRRAKETALSISDEAKAEADPDRQSNLWKHAIRTQALSRLEAMVTAAQSEPEVAIMPDVFDVDPWLFNCANGTLDLRTRKLLPHRREDRLTKRSDVPYSPDAECPLWLGAMDRWMDGNEELIGFTQRALGVCLTGITRDECFFLRMDRDATGRAFACGRVST